VNIIFLYMFLLSSLPPFVLVFFIALFLFGGSWCWTQGFAHTTRYFTTWATPSTSSHIFLPQPCPVSFQVQLFTEAITKSWSSVRQVILDHLATLHY
jgi:hypothetical protein